EMEKRRAAMSKGVSAPVEPTRETMLKPDQHSTTMPAAIRPRVCSEDGAPAAGADMVACSVAETLRRDGWPLCLIVRGASPGAGGHATGGKTKRLPEGSLFPVWRAVLRRRCCVRRRRFLR